MFNYRIVISGTKEDIKGICNWLKKDDEYCKNLRDSVKSYEGRFQVLAAWLSARGVEPEEYVVSLQKYIDSRRLDPSKIKVSKNAIQINDEKFIEQKPEESKTNALKFTEYIHANYPVMEVEKPQYNVVSDEDAPVIVNDDNSIQIFEINNANDGRRLVGNDTSWCIGYVGPSNMWQSYRDSHDASFFVVVDNDPPTPDQRKVAIDFTGQGEVLLTDIPNITSRTLSNDMDWNEYSEYLRSKGIDLGATRQNLKTGKDELILKNKPRTPEEIIQKAVFEAQQKINLEIVKQWQSGTSYADKWSLGRVYEEFIEPNIISDDARNYVTFKNPEAKYYTSRWMALGKDVYFDVIDFLMNSVGGIDIVSKYVNTGLGIKDPEIYERIKTNKQLFTSYLRSRVNAAEQSYITLTVNEFDDLLILGRKDLIIAYVKTGKAAFDDLPNDIKRLHIDAKLEKRIGLTGKEMDFVFDKDKDEDRLAKILELGGINLHGGKFNVIKDNPRLLSIAINRLPIFHKEWVDELRPRILSMGDGSLAASFAVKFGFSANEIKLAKEIGGDFELIAKISVSFHKADEETVKLFDPENPNDVNCLQTISSVGLIEPFLDDERWRNAPVLAWVEDSSYGQKLNSIRFTSEDDKTVNSKVLPSNPMQMLLFFIIHMGQMPLTVIQDSNYDVKEEDQENLRRVYLEFSSAINTIEFWHNFIKAFPNLSKNIGMSALSSYFMILKFIPEQFFEDDTILDFINKKNILNQNRSYFLNKINFSEHPKLLDIFMLKSLDFGENLRSLNPQSKLAYIEKALEKDKSLIYYAGNITILSPKDRLDIVKIYLSLYPEEREKLHITIPNIIRYLLYNNKNINYQLWLLRNLPEAVRVYIMEKSSLKDFAPEVRAIMKQMFPEMAYKINEFEAQKYGPGGYFDEETEEVVQAPRPAPEPISDEEFAADLQKMLQDQDPFAPDDDRTASIKLMVKIARKLDLKKKYTLADKFTNIMSRYNV